MNEAIEKTSTKTKEAIEKTSNQIRELKGYNQNQARILKTTCTEALRRHVIDAVGVNESYILEFLQKVLYNPTSASIAVEWDGILPVDYRQRPASETRRQAEPEHNTLFLLRRSLLCEQRMCSPRQINGSTQRKMQSTLTTALVSCRWGGQGSSSWILRDILFLRIRPS